MGKKINLSDYQKEEFIGAENYSVGIVVSEWNEEVTGALYKGAFDTLIENGILEDNIYTINVPGSFELTSGAQMLIDYYPVEAVICLGCVIQGETRHFEFICNAVANGITKISIENKTPVIFGVLTTDNFEQAKARSGGKHGNKGVEAAYTALKMLKLNDDLILDSGILDDNLDE